MQNQIEISTKIILTALGLQSGKTELPKLLPKKMFSKIQINLIITYP